MNPEEFKTGTFWKKTFKPAGSYIIFKIIGFCKDGRADVIIYKDCGYGSYSEGIVIPPYSNEIEHKFKKLKENDVFLEVI